MRRTHEGLRLIFGGDTMLGRGVAGVIREEGPEYPLEPIAPITRAADAFLLNLECAVTDRALTFSGAPKAFYFRADSEAVRTLTSAGVDYASLANNHALDADYAGLEDTLSTLQEHGIKTSGAGMSLEEASRAAVFIRDGTRLGVLAYCDHQADFAARAERPGIRFIRIRDGRDADAMSADVAAMSARVDHVITSVHWQHNWAPAVDSIYRVVARRLVDAGARIVWGHSPHHFQGVEWIGDAVVLYSTGDLVDDYAVHPEFRNDRQLLFEVRLGEGVESVRALPLQLKFGRTGPAGEEEREWIRRRFEHTCAEVNSAVDSSGPWLAVRPA